MRRDEAQQFVADLEGLLIREAVEQPDEADLIGESQAVVVAATFGDLDQVGLILARRNGVTTVAGIAQKDGADTVSGVQPGDTLLKIDGIATPPLTRGELLAALHGKSGEIKHLTLEREANEFEVDVLVTAF